MRLGRARGTIDPWAVLAGGVLLALLAVALFGDRIAPHEPVYFVVEHDGQPRPYDPGVVFPLGSDVLGRDLLSLVLVGARATLAIVLLGGLARVAAGVLIAAVGGWWRPTRLLTDLASELASAVPATLVALLVVKVFVKTDTTVLVFVGALVLIGWAGPYRVARAEIDRLRSAGFVEGAHALGVGRWRLFWRHQLPHLVPLLAVNLSQQVVASLVLLAELGVLNAFVGATRQIDIQESLSVVRPGPVNEALLADSSEWGGLLATSRTTEALWVTRWLILLPGAAFALTAIAVALIGFALGRRYARRDVLRDLRGAGTIALAVATVAMATVSVMLPERYAPARDWAAAARAEVRPAADVEGAFREAGLRPVGADFALRRKVATVAQTAAATIRVGTVTKAEPWPRTLTDRPDPGRAMRSFVTSGTGGGGVEAPVVFAGRGISAADYQPERQPIGVPQRPQWAALIGERGYADDYAGIQVRGKVVLLVRPYGIQTMPTSSVRPGTEVYADGPAPEDSIANAIKRGAAAVVFVDPSLTLYNDLPTAGIVYGVGPIRGGINPYYRAEQDRPATDPRGVPVVVVDQHTAAALFTGSGIDFQRFVAYDQEDPSYRVSPSRDLGISARVEVPLRPESATTTSFVAEVAGATDDAARVVVWSARPSGGRPGAAVLGALARALGPRSVPFVLVEFDPSIDAAANARLVRDALGARRIGLVIVLEELGGSALRFTTPHGDLIPAFDLYAQRAGAAAPPTRRTARVAEMSGHLPFADVKTILVRGSGGEDDVSADAAAVLGYLAARIALGAEEVPR